MASRYKEIEEFFIALDIDTEVKRSSYRAYDTYEKKDDSVAEVTFIHSEKESAIDKEE